MTSAPQGKTHYIHRISYSTQEKLVGFFVLTALSLALVLLILNSRQLHLFDEPLQVRLEVKTAEGISRDTPVRISGIEVGRVDRIEITEDHSILLYARVHGRYKSLVRVDSVASIGKLSLLGRSSIEITPGSPQKPLVQEGALLPVEEALSIDDLLAQVEPVLRGVEETVHNIARLSAAFEPEQLAGLLKKVVQTSADIQAVTGQVAAGQGPLGQLLYDPGIETQITGILHSLEASLQTTQKHLVGLQPTLTEIERLSQTSSQALPALLEETHQLLRGVNTTLAAVNQEMTHLPTMIQRVDLLMEQTDRLLDRIQSTWPLSRRDEQQLPHRLEVLPRD